MTQSSNVDSLEEAEANLLRAKLHSFLTLNPQSAFITANSEHVVAKLWGEDGIEIPLSGDNEDLLEALNATRLPPRFTAIWHEDTSEFEVIYTVLSKDNHLGDRQFAFWYKDQSYDCQFGPSSSRLRAIARQARPSGSMPSINFRNLQLLKLFEDSVERRANSPFVKNREPTSFWIRGIGTYDDDLIGGLVRNLNFHMSYFDRTSPTILVHEESTASGDINDQSRTAAVNFPDTISAQDIDQHLLVLWASAEEGDPFHRFIQYYQILEYSGFYHVKDKVRREVERAIVAPDASARPDRVAQQLLEAIAEDNRSDSDKINAVIDECVDPSEMWDVLEGSLSEFSERIELDGGFVLPSVISSTTDREGFLKSWNRHFSAALHQVRNALVHARESRQSTMIAPTTANRARLSRWLLPLSETAARVMLYGRL